MQKLIEKQSKKLLIDRISKRLMGLEFKSNHSIKLRALKYVVKKYFYYYKIWKINV